MSVRANALATLRGKAWMTQHSQGRDSKLTGEQIIAAFDVIQTASRQGLDPKRDLLALFPGAYGNSDRRIDRTLQKLKSFGLIIYKPFADGGRTWCWTVVEAGGEE